ncbi:DUF11 domain-containing protein, partial [Candidatus Kuenenbacteria bacterium]|nr:DUF11 domain-containing protein [Candidatus Kuenenbacteria bacterium]
TLTVVVSTDAGKQSNGEQIVNNVKIQSGIKTANATATTTVNKGGGGSTPDLSLTYTFAQTKILGSSYLETVTLKNTGNVTLTNGVLTVDIPGNLIKYVSATPNWNSYNTTTETAVWQIASLETGKDITFRFTVRANAVGTPRTDVTAAFDQASKSANWSENIITARIPNPPIVVAAATSTANIVPPTGCPERQECQACATAECTTCKWWLWLIVILLHLLALFTYYFFVSKEELKQDENGEYYIVKGSAFWALPVFLTLVIIFLLLTLICNVAPWWALALILLCYYLALAANHKLIKLAELKYGPVFPLLITLAVLIAYLICHSWYWWVLVAVIVFYVLALGTYYFMVIKMNSQNRSYWWLAPLFATGLVIVLEMVLRMCHCGEVIK